MHFNTLTAEPDGDEVRLETLRGKKHLVAPVVLVREGVLNGGFLSYEEIERSEPGWNGRPVTAPPSANESGHPTRDGEFVSANQDPFIESMHSGFLMNVEAREDLPTPNGENPKGLHGEVWVELEAAKDVGEQAVEAARRLAEGEALEVSTGYWHAFEKQRGEFEGETFERVQMDLMPDHLALLPNETGACSWDDGCGAPRAAANARTAEAVNATLGSRVLAANELAKSANLLEQARTPTYEGTESGEWSAPDLEDYVSAWNYGEVESVEDLTQEERQAIAETSLLGDPSADSFAELVFFPVVDPEGKLLNENALDAVLSGRGAQADISEDQLQSARGIARTLLEDEFDRELSDNVGEGHPVLSRIKNLLGMADGKGAGPRGGSSPDDGGGCPCGGTAANCDCGGHDTGNMSDEIKELAEATAFDLETLKDMSDEKIAALSETVEGIEGDADDDGGDDGTDTTGNADGGDADGDVPESVEQELESLRSELDALKSEREQSEREAAIEELTANAGVDPEDVPDDADPETIRALAESFEGTGYAGQSADRVNRLGQAGGRAGNAESEDDEALTANVGAMAALDAAEGGD